MSDHNALLCFYGVHGHHCFHAVIHIRTKWSKSASILIHTLIDTLRTATYDGFLFSKLHRPCKNGAGGLILQLVISWLKVKENHDYAYNLSSFLSTTVKQHFSCPIVEWPCLRLTSREANHKRSSRQASNLGQSYTHIFLL